MRKPDPNVRIAVTGAGIVCAIGRDKAEVWRAIRESRDGIRKLTRLAGETFPTNLAAEVAEELRIPITKRDAKRLSRTDLLALVAANEAIEQASESAPLPRERAIAATGTSTGGLLEGEEYYFERLVRGRRRAHASRVIQQPTSAPSDAVAKVFGLGGGAISNATACASAGAAIGIAADYLRSRHADVAIAGGSDALCRLTYSGFNVLQAVDEGPCTPFDANRKGITLGEGAAYLVLERWEDAVTRRATILAELCSYGASCDAHHPTAPAEDGCGAEAAMRAAIAVAQVSAIDYVNAHGTGTLLNDSAESRAIHSALGASVPVSSSKSYFGHTLGASGALEAVISILALQEQLAPPTLRLNQAASDCSPLDYIPNTPRPMPMEHVLSNTFGFGGSNVSLLFRRVL
ncbi:MAG TPA: beta-ketoacyl-[acyl-carrier-protein] synthase family protein [Thermoanaerobaculia bacterium]|jgi:3-oxoacyl-[acyl-carrier-protein] synthase II|nr:beta-ketoacyl-[acyl-carrier-protein] synthase family protein [Thermoanaerobaculia bacterium]